MIATDQDVKKRLRYIIHRGLVEIRNLAYAGSHEQIAALADAMEILPRYLDHCNEKDLEMVSFVLGNYDSTFPNRYDYIRILDGEQAPPERH